MMRGIVLATVLSGCANAFLLHPPEQSNKHADRRRTIADRDGSIEVFVAASEPGTAPRAYVLCFFGNGNVADEPVIAVAEMMRPLSLELWGVNYPGYGRSEGKATLDGVARAARIAYRAVAAQAQGKPIILFGSSLGSAAALHVAAHERVAGVVLHNPPPLRRLILCRYGWFNLWLVALPIALQIPHALDSIANAKRSKAPAVFISSSDDGVVPIGYQERVMKAYAGDWKLLENLGAGHNAEIPDWIISAMVETIGSWLPSAAASP